MERKVLLRVLTLLLGFSYVLSLVAAAPLSRSLKLVGEASSSTNQELVMQFNFISNSSSHHSISQCFSHLRVPW
ncbi:hypothetical protein MKW94_003775 [Papaver nudicaule]|uniref:Uncharacterized protein n=1 Tax=Papaver nudicaule TaxID=74823 RepID=A0AA42AVS8_PAPNU|nr:hypothetical protein [Papaver nudicaule]